MSTANDFKERRTRRKRQARINIKLKKRLFWNVAFAPCRYCKHVFLVDKLTIEHIIPLSMGGTNNEDNIDLACGPCNQEKGREAWFIKRGIMKEIWKNS